jgi:hypothetical protein
MSQRRHSTGSPLRRSFTLKARAASLAADREALDHGNLVAVFSLYWADYGQYPRSPRGCWLDLAPDRPVIRPVRLFGFRGQGSPVQERILSARVAPRRHWYGQSARPNPKWADAYSLDNGMVVSCKTSGGTLRFVVARIDGELMVYYLKRLEVQPVDAG